MIGPDEELPGFITADDDEETGADGWERGGGRVLHMSPGVLTGFRGNS